MDGIIQAMIQQQINFLSTTENAGGWNKYCKNNARTKDNITVDTTQVSINNFTINRWTR